MQCFCLIYIHDHFSLSPSSIASRRDTRSPLLTIHDIAIHESTRDMPMRERTCTWGSVRGKCRLDLGACELALLEMRGERSTSDRREIGSIVLECSEANHSQWSHETRRASARRSRTSNADRVDALLAHRTDSQSVRGSPAKGE